MSTPQVSISGYAFASIINEASKCRGDTEGLLFGEMTTRNVCLISDSQSSGNREECNIAIQDTIPMDGCFSFYNYLGHLLQEKLEGWLTNSNLAIAGWYKIRRNSSLKPSLREQNVIKRLLSSQQAPSKILFLLFAPSSQGSLSTLNFPYKCFLCEKNQVPGNLQMNVVNLGHTGTHPEYRLRSLLIPAGTESRQSMHDICDNATPHFCDQHGQMFLVQNAFYMYSEAVHRLQVNLTQLSESENVIHGLRMDIQRLKEKIKTSTAEASTADRNGDSEQPSPMEQEFTPSTLQKPRDF